MLNIFFFGVYGKLHEICCHVWDYLLQQVNLFLTQDNVYTLDREKFIYESCLRQLVVIRWCFIFDIVFIVIYFIIEILDICKMHFNLIIVSINFGNQFDRMGSTVVQKKGSIYYAVYRTPQKSTG